MKLNSRQNSQLRQALLHAFPSKVKLACMLKFELDWELESISPHNQISEAIFDVVQYATSQGSLQQLLVAAQSSNSQDSALQEFVQHLTPSSGTANIDIEALMYALAQQQQSLPQELQAKLKAVAPSFQNHDPNASQQIRELIRQHQSLEAAYRKALEDWDANYASQERSKSLSQTFPVTSGFGLIFTTDVMPSDDWVRSVKRIAKQQDSWNAASFWDNLDRIGIMGVGGGFMGGAIVQLFGGGATQLIGAGIGLLVGGFYGWQSSINRQQKNHK